MMYKLTDKIFIHGDDLKIVDFLTDLGVKLDDSSNRVMTFFQKGNLYLILYFAKDGDRGFIMYEVLGILDNLHELASVKSILTEQLNSGNNINILKSAIEQVEIIQMAGKAAKLFK